MILPDSVCFGYDGYVLIFCYVWKTDPLQNHDYDCDATFDSQDPNPGTPDGNAPAENGNPGCNTSTGTK
jgi:hypothetical protein